AGASRSRKGGRNVVSKRGKTSAPDLNAVFRERSNLVAFGGGIEGRLFNESKNVSVGFAFSPRAMVSASAARLARNSPWAEPNSSIIVPSHGFNVVALARTALSSSAI